MVCPTTATSPCNLNVKHAADPDGLPVMETSTIGDYLSTIKTPRGSPDQPSSARSTANPSERLDVMVEAWGVNKSRKTAAIEQQRDVLVSIHSPLCAVGQPPQGRTLLLTYKGGEGILI